MQQREHGAAAIHPRPGASRRRPPKPSRRSWGTFLAPDGFFIVPRDTIAAQVAANLAPTLASLSPGLQRDSGPIRPSSQRFASEIVPAFRPGTG